MRERLRGEGRDTTGPREKGKKGREGSGKSKGKGLRSSIEYEEEESEN